MAEITPTALLSLLCTPEDRALDPRILPAAVQQAHPERAQTKAPTVFICQKGRKLSQGAAA